MLSVELLGGLAIALAGMPFAGLVVSRYRASPPDTRRDLLASDAVKWLLLAVLCGYVVFVEGRPLSSMTGRSFDPSSFAIIVVTGTIVLFTASAVTTPLFNRFGVGGLEGEMSQLTSLSRRQRIFVAVTAGVTEEALFHGYAIERLLELTGNPLLAGGISFVAFTLGHAVGWNRGAVARIAVPALLTTVLYLIVRDVVALMAIHSLNNVASLLLAGAIATDSSGAGGVGDTAESADGAASQKDEPSQ
ncbi:CPBP family intramembrane glutamic endopeptidase [Haloferax larsenii]|uniref:CAAX protease self-immunity n=1 Tax=Haloferax larsenii TaxID=302484 RepID=A0A1H7LGQ0_HALLR|nr:CPBP family intramembrane glutamic endopeptidase [Haloferax larsenii]SEK98122.1 CAAX protease self-immunity [Haloferax larsenii]